MRANELKTRVVPIKRRMRRIRRIWQILFQRETSNELSEERKVEVLKEMFPGLNEDKVKQALECANSDVTLALNKVLEDTGECLCMSLSHILVEYTL